MIEYSAHQSPRLSARLVRLLSPTNRRMLTELVVSSFRVNDHNAFLGIGWSLLNPLIMLGIMYFLFKDRFGQNIPAYAVYLLLGVVTVNFFISVTRQVMPIFVTSKFLFTNSTVPRETVIAANLTLVLYKYVFELAVCIVLAFIQGVFAGEKLLLLVPFLVAFTAFTLGTGMLLSLAYVYVRDVEHAWGLVTRLLFFVTPVFYSLDALSEPSAKLIFWLNPLTPFLLTLRSIVMNTPPFTPLLLLYSLFLGFGTFAVGYGIFVRREAQAVERG